MRIKSTLAAAAAAFGLVATSAAAQSDVQPIPARQSTELAGQEASGGSGFLVPLLAVIAIVLGILAATGGDDADLPNSP